jgi:hypothetical protein
VNFCNFLVGVVPFVVGHGLITGGLVWITTTVRKKSAGFFAGTVIGMSSVVISTMLYFFAVVGILNPLLLAGMCR